MLRIATLHAVEPRVRYHTGSAALTPEEKTGRWVGAGCAAAGLVPDSPVNPAELRALLTGHSPDGHYLGQNRKLRRRAAWDLVFSTHKSISVAGLCLDDATRAAVREAYDEAVTALPALIDALAARQNAGLRPIATGNTIIARFTHLRSRHNDPHLHTHCLVMNATLDSADERGPRWKSLEPAPLFRNHKALDLAFNRELLRALHQRRIPAVLDHNHRASLPFVPNPVCARLSKANAALRAAATQPREDKLAALNEEHYRDLLNDRLRPRKSPHKSAPPLRKMVPSFEQRLIAKNQRAIPLPDPPLTPLAPPSPATLAAAIQDHYRRLTLFHSPKALFSAMVLAAKASLHVPIHLFVTAQKLARFHPTTSPRPPPPTRRLATHLLAKASEHWKNAAYSPHLPEAQAPVTNLSQSLLLAHGRKPRRP